MSLILAEFRYILSRLQVSVDEVWGPCIELIDFEHQDYIEDVLVEIFDIEYSFNQSNEDNEKTILYFEDKVSFDSLVKAVAEINIYHETNGIAYILPSEPQ